MLSFTSLSGLPVSTAFSPDARIVFQTPSGQFLNSQMDQLKTYMTAEAIERIQALEDGGGSGGGGPSIWPTARKLTLAGKLSGDVSFDGSEDFTLTADVVEGSLSFIHVNGLSAEFNNVSNRLNSIDIELNNKANVNHDHLQPWADLNTPNSGFHPYGLSQSYFNGGGQNISSIFEVCNEGMIFQLRAKSDLINSLFFRTLQIGASAFGTEYSIWHSGNFIPDLYARLAATRTVFSGAVRTTTSLGLDDGTSKDRFRIERDANATWFRTVNDTTAVRDFAHYGVEDFRVDGRKVYHEGNLDLNSILMTGGAIREVFQNPPVVYTASQDFNALPAGRAVLPQASPNSPGNTSAQWYVETTITNTSSTRLQKAIGLDSSEVWLRSFGAGSWSSWRRQWDNSNLTTANFLTRGSNGLGGTATAAGTDINGLTQSGWYSYMGAQGPTSDVSYLINHIQGATTAIQKAYLGQGAFQRNRDSGGGWTPWLVVAMGTIPDFSSKWNTSAAQAHGFEGAPVLQNAMNLRDIQGLSFFTANTASATSAPPFSGAGQALTLQMQPGSLTAGGLAQISVLGTENNNPEMFVRSGAIGSYGAWARVFTDKNLDISPLWGQKANIGSGVNLNTVTAPGYYQQMVDANATLALNYPRAGVSGFLEVFTPTAGYTWQEYRSRNSHWAYRRYLFGGVWSVWATMYTSGTGVDQIGNMPGMSFMSPAGFTSGAKGWQIFANITDTSDTGFHIRGWNGADWNYGFSILPGDTSRVNAHGSLGVQTGMYTMMANGNRLWTMGYETNREWKLWGYDDNGGYIVNPLSVTRAGELKVQGAISAGGRVISTANHFNAVAAVVVLGCAVGGQVLLRPNGPDNTGGQATVDVGGIKIAEGQGEGQYRFGVDDWYYFSNAQNMGWYSAAGGYGLRLAKASKTITAFGYLEATDFGLTSDERTKKNIVDMEFNGRLRPRQWTDPKSGLILQGFVSQEVMENYPTFVRKDDAGIYRLAYPRMVAVVSHQVNAVEDEVAALKKENQEMAERVSKLEALVEQLIKA